MDRYAQQAAALAEELIASLSEQEVQALRECFEAATSADWLSWRAEHASDIDAFVRATPAGRRRRKRWREAFPLLTHAGYLHCMQAHAMLAAVARFDLSPGGPYRNMAAQAGRAFQAAVDADCDYPDWPWRGPSPIPWERGQE